MFSSCQDSNCVLCGSEACITCKSGYYLNKTDGCTMMSSTVTPVPAPVPAPVTVATTKYYTTCQNAGCALCDDTKCITCKPGFSINLNTGGCWQCPANCNACEYGSQYCTNCNSGYIIKGTLRLFILRFEW
jgi:hypothetical protein